MTTNMNIRVDKEVKEAADSIFDELGISMTTAFNIFLRQVIRSGGIPFELKVGTPNAETASAIEECDRIARDPNVKGYKTMEELRTAIENEIRS